MSVLSSKKAAPSWFLWLLKWGLLPLKLFLPARWLVEIEHMAWFLAIGGVNTLISYIIYLVLLTFFDFGVSEALLGAYVLALGVSYLNFRAFVFKGGSPESWKYFFPAGGVVYLVNLGMLHAVLALGLSKELGQLLLLPVVAGVSYVVNRFFVFRWSGEETPN